jgi:hypothetical protein
MNVSTASFVVGLVLASVASAEIVDMSRSGLESTATHIITGKVMTIRETTATEGEWKVTYYVAGVQLDRVEKGEGMKKGDTIEVHYWRRSRIPGGTPRPDTNGYRGLPAQDETLRIYLRNKKGIFGRAEDGLFNVVGPNGFERLEKK